MIIRFIANIATKVRLFYVITKKLLAFFSKTYQSSLNLKGGPTAHLGLLPLREEEETAPLNSLYAPFGSPCRGQRRRS